ncbi:MAG: lactonase family protein [Gammaproteobacteria bacterium]|nr:MAG: lactonase family protein [Gammaproteobacteria bacterium]
MMSVITRPNAGNTRDLVMIVAPLLLAACSGGSGCVTVHAHPGECAPPLPPPPTYSVLGYVGELTGSGLTLSYNGGTPVAITRNGAITLAMNLPVGTKYSVAVANQPTNPAQTCTISNGSGAVGNFDVSVLVYCPQAVGAWAFVATTGSITTTPGVPSVPGSLSAYAIDVNSGALSLVPGSAIPTGPAVGTVQLVPHSSYLWALSIGDASAADNNTLSSIYVYTANANSGLLTANGGNPFFTLNGTSATPAACNGIGGPGSTIAVTFAPSGTFGYDLLGANQAQNNGTYVFTTASGVPQFPGLAVPNDCDTPTIVDPSGQFAYYGTFVSSGLDSLVANTVDPTTGALTALPGYSPPTLVESGPVPPTVDPFGRFVYSIRADLIDAYAINHVSGAVADIGPFTAPPAAISMLISPDGRFAYVTASGGLYIYSIDGTGLLNSVGSPVPLQIAAGQTLAAPGVTTATQIDPSGQFLYASASAGSGQQGIYAYTRDASTGALTLVPGSPFAVTSQTAPLQLALH